MLLLQDFLGLKSNEWILIGVAACSLILILVTVLLIVKSRKKKGAKNANTAYCEQEDLSSAEQSAVEEEAVSEAVEDGEIAQEVENGEDSGNDEGEEKQSGKQSAKPANKVYHISKRKSDNRWQVKMSKGARAIKLFFTQAEAIDYAKKLAVSQDARIIIHKEDGSFRKLTYKNKK